MYTVAVFDGSQVAQVALAELVALVNQSSSFERVEKKRRGTGYVCGICEDKDWAAHLSAIDRFLIEHADRFRLAAEAGISIVFDTAVSSDGNSEGMLWTTFAYPANLIQRMAASGAAPAISVYPTGTP